MSATKEDVPYDGLVSPKVEADVEKGTIRGASIGRMMLISLPRIATQMAWAAQGAAVGPYLSTMLPNYAVQLTQLIGPLTGIFTAPTVGVCSDRSTNKWGRRRPFMVYAAITSIICWIGMAYTREMAEGLGDYGTKDHGSRKWTATFNIIFYAWMDITVNVAQTPAQLLIADFAGDRQTLGAGIGQAWSVVGALLVSLYIALFGPAHKTMKSFMAMLCVIMAVTVGVACICAKEEPLEVDEEKKSKGAQICDAFKSIGRGLKALPGPLIVYAIVYFCLCYGNSAYTGSKGQFFGIILKDGDPDGADSCSDHCTEKQKAYNDGVQIAGGTSDLIYNIEGYVFSWILPLLVRKFGAKWTLIVSLIPEALLIVMALCKNVWVDVVLVVLTNIAQTAISTMIVPVIVHVVGDKEDVGMYVGALNSANCFGMLLNFLIGSALVQTPMGFQFPVLLGGIVSAVGLLIAVFFLKIEMYSL